MKITNYTHNTFYPKKVDFNHIENYDDFRNKIDEDMKNKNYSDEQILSVNTFLTISMVVANAQENKKQGKSYWDTEKRAKDFENASNALKIKMLKEQIAIIKNPHTIQKGTYMGQPESQEHFQERKNQATDYLKELLQEF